MSQVTQYVTCRVFRQRWAFAEFQRALIRERQCEGIAIAKQRGAWRRRKKSLSDGKAAEIVLMDAARNHTLD
jgi:DNA invertase Pin-like site-specific DNA recombinase